MYLDHVGEDTFYGLLASLRGELFRSPGFVWVATGPVLEDFSKHPVVKKANAPDELMSVSEFPREVRRMVVDFVLGRVPTRGKEEVVTSLADMITYHCTAMALARGTLR